MPLLDDGSVLRFWAKVQSGDPRACWEWEGARDTRGYGVIRIKGVLYRAHRVALSLALDRWVANDLAVLHGCDNPPCVNSGHLREGTLAENTRDMHRKGRAGARHKTQCVRGHELNAANRYPVKGGWSVCLACKRLLNREHVRAKRAARKEDANAQ